MRTDRTADDRYRASGRLAAVCVLVSAAADLARVRLATNRQRNEAGQCTDGEEDAPHEFDRVPNPAPHTGRGALGLATGHLCGPDAAN
jgi:hypothetical protein